MSPAKIIRASLLAAALMLDASSAIAVERPALTAPGVTAPVVIDLSGLDPYGTRPADRDLPKSFRLPPGLFISFAPGTTASCSVEWTAQVADKLATASWKLLSLAPGLVNVTATTFGPLPHAVTAVRLNCPTLSSGSVVFGVAQ